MFFLKELCSGVKQWCRNRKGSRRRAIDGLLPAIIATIQYITALSDGEEVCRNKERELFGLWLTASTEVHSYDPELSARCLEKANYWLKPLLYDKKKISELNISLIGMRAELEKIKSQ